MMHRVLLTLGALTLAAAVALGAFGAHALKGRLDPYALEVYDRAVFYQFVHGLGVLLVFALPALEPQRQSAIAFLFLGGVVVFSGSLYILALSGMRSLGAVTPLGGVSFIAGWVLLAWTLWQQRELINQ